MRGLRETEIATYLDGTRIFPGGAARMDSPLSHLDPSGIRSIEVVKGPYALTWGAGSLSAIRVETHDLPPTVPGPMHGRFEAGYDSNYGARETAATLFGENGGVSYWLHGAGRAGDDYESGAGQTIPPTSSRRRSAARSAHARALRRISWPRSATRTSRTSTTPGGC